MSGYSEVGLFDSDVKRLDKLLGGAVDGVISHLPKDYWGKGGVFQGFWCEQPDKGRVGLRRFHCAWAGGEENRAREGTYKKFAQEEAYLLAENRMRGHVSSLQSRNDRAGQVVAGAIFFTCRSPRFEREYRLLFSFAGLPEEACEAAMVWLVARTTEFWQTPIEKLQEILAFSNNKMMSPELLKELHEFL